MAEYRFGQCILGLEEQTLRCNGTLIPLPPKAVAALAVLARSQGDVISKQTLMNEVWGEAAVEEANLTQNIYRLRRALGAHDPTVRIQNIPCRGYRLDVDPLVSLDAAAQTLPRRVPWAVLGLAVAVLVGLSATVWRSVEPVPVPASYATGYSIWSRARSIADVRKSMTYFERAVAEQPASAFGYAGLAYAHLSIALRDEAIAQQALDIRSAFVAARKAVAVGPNASEAHAAFGQAEALFDDPTIAERELARAVDLDPDSIEARTWLGELFMSQGRIAPAMVQFRAALAINSTWTEAGDDLALLYYLRRDYADAAAYADQSIMQEPLDEVAPYVLALANAQLHQRTLAEAQLRTAAATVHDSLPALKAHALLSLLYLQDGNPRLSASEFRSTRRMLQRIGPVGNPSTLISIAATMALQHRTATAFAWLARVDQTSRRLFADDARLDSLRTDRRFALWLSRS